MGKNSTIFTKELKTAFTKAAFQQWKTVSQFQNKRIPPTLIISPIATVKQLSVTAQGFTPKTYNVCQLTKPKEPVPTIQGATLTISTSSPLSTSQHQPMPTALKSSATKSTAEISMQKTATRKTASTSQHQPLPTALKPTAATSTTDGRS